MILKPLCLDDMELVRRWRNEIPETLRTPYMLTEEMQEDYYRDVICNRNGNTRYWGFWQEVIPREWDKDLGPDKTQWLFGYGGIENIRWEDRQGEISILIAPDYRNKGYGAEGVELILNQAFMFMNLDRVYGECFHSSVAVEFWIKMVAEYRGFQTSLPDRKYFNGTYWSSFYFMFSKEEYIKKQEESA